MEEFPAPPSLSALVRSEEDMWLGWIRDSVDRHGLNWTKEQLVNEAKQLGGKELAAALEEALVSGERLSGLMEETSGLFEDCGRVAALRLDQFRPAAASRSQSIRRIRWRD